MGGSCIMAVSAGRILILPKGSYDSTTTYEFLDAVYYQGSTYICKKTALNVLPSNTEYWQIMAQGTSSASVAGNYYAECDTSASTPAKVITVPATEYFVLQVGDIVNVKFTYTNTATNPTLNINNTGNKPIVYDTSAVTTDNLWAGGEAGRITSFMYDGTNWVWISHDVDTNTLDALLDTAISSPTNKQGLIFNGTSNKWENGNITSTLAELEDTTITNVANGQILKYNGTSNKWENADIDEPVADDVIYDNTDSGLTANNVQDAIDEVNTRVTELEKEHILEFDINSVAVTTAWGGLYASSEVSLSISSLGLLVAPKVVSLLYIDQTGGIAIPIFSRISATELKITLARGTSATITGKIEAILRY